MGQEPCDGQQELHRHQGDARRRRRRTLIRRRGVEDDAALDRGRRALVRQRSGDDCGPAALAGAAAWLGLEVDHHALIDAAGLRRGGTDLARLAAMARGLGLQSHAVHADDRDPAVVSVPAILHLEGRFAGGHFVVLTGCDERRAVVLDPARGCRLFGRASLRRRWTGYALELSRRGAAPAATLP